jgi:heat shock protein HspQ
LYLNIHFTNLKKQKMAAAEKKFTILIDGHNSKNGVFGYAGHFQVANIQYTLAQSEYDYGSSQVTRKPELPTFSLIAEGNAGRYVENVLELEEKLEDIGEDNKQQKVTLFTLINTSQSGKTSTLDTWETHFSQELPDAQLLPIKGTDKMAWVVKADKTILGRGDKATHKININYRDGTGK